jgi:hypothetical protein
MRIPKPDEIVLAAGVARFALTSEPSPEDGITETTRREQEIRARSIFEAVSTASAVSIDDVDSPSLLIDVGGVFAMSSTGDL